MTKTGTRVTLTSNRAIFAGRDMYEMELVSVLYCLSASSLTDPEHENQRKDVREHPNRCRYYDCSNPVDVLLKLCES